MVLTEEMLKYAESVQPEVIQLLKDLCAIPAPSHHEEKRAEFCRKWFVDNGFENVTIDEALNVLAPVNCDGDKPISVVMAHTDTVFPDTEPMPLYEKDGRLYSPGVGDDSANLAVLMVCARYYKDHFPGGDRGMLFVANSCEEGLGNLKGSRRIVDDYGKRIEEFTTLDSNRMDRLVVRAVGSHRYNVTVRTEGGHSYGGFGRRNAIHALSELITLLYSVEVPQKENCKTTYNVGMISGGTSVNTIAQEASMLFEYRSDDLECLKKMQNIFEDAIKFFRTTGVDVTIERIGDRPCSGKVNQRKIEKLRNRIRTSVKEVLGLDMLTGSSSTDCNAALAKGIPAICFGVCRSMGTHTRNESVEIASLYDGCRLLLDFLYRK